MNERDRLERAKRGDIEARNELFAAHRSSLPRDLPEDVAQDTWTTALRALPGFQGASSFKTWLNGIAKNLRRGDSRRERRRTRGVGGDADPVALVPDRLPAPLDELIGKERARLVRQAVEGLSADLHEAVTRLMDGESFHAIVSGMSEKQRVTRYRASQRLAGALESLADQLPEDL
jgi:RNA polymerase sigma factor (sigma-70 family)